MLVYVWPEHVEAFRVFLSLQAAWEYPDGFGGGRLTVPAADVRAHIDLLDLEPARRAEVFWQVQQMIFAARAVLLDAIAQRRAQSRQEPRRRG